MPALPDLPISGLTVHDLADILNVVRPMSEQFDTATLGRPFVAPYGSVAGVVEDTPVGAVFAYIEKWMNHQVRRVLQQLAEVEPRSPDEADLRASLVVGYDLLLGDWSAAAERMSKFTAEAKAMGGKGA